MIKENAVPKSIGSDVRPQQIRQIAIHVFHERYKRRSIGIVTLSVPASTPGFPDPWIALLVQALADQSSRIERAETTVGRITHALAAACAEPHLDVVWNRHLSDLTKDDLNTLFSEIESRLKANVQLSESLRYHGSLQFRKLCRLLIPQLRSDLQLEGVKFKTSFHANPQPRSLISDQYTPGNAPQGAMPYENPRELKRKMLDASERVLQITKKAAVDDLEKGAQLRALLDVLKEKVTDTQFINAVCLVTRTQQYSKSSYDLVPYSAPEQYIGALVHAHDNEQWSRKGSAPGILYGKKVDQFLLNAIGWKVRLTRAWRIRSFATLQEIHSCVVILQIVSSWNVSSVLDIRLEDILLVKGGYVIQSFKSKTDTHTPPVKLSKDDETPDKACDFTNASQPEACKALTLLIWNHKQLVANNYQKECDTRLINSAFALSDQPGTLTVQHLQRQFIERHALPKFSPEQLRNESLFATSLGSLSKAQRDAGHTSISTTGNYIRQLVAKRLHSSQNLQFQRQFAAELKALQRKEVQHSELRLLRPIGDGASCIDPASHPWADIPEKECPGDRCHGHGGCESRVLRINQQRIAEALLTERVYETNWQALCEQNPSAFLEYDVPRIIFVKGFLHMTSESTLGHVVTRLRRELTQKKS
ncbi:hypothetical protein [Variovorax sp. PAMC 28711]|uniref:hypothetical protein n=1 Tax=Variovorax sp. PAMC 28711 TaxID=1795631 RepID=UPI000AE1ECD7|nr:hypothetical protein [Variovorax sp. PAMC 28711]